MAYLLARVYLREDDKLEGKLAYRRVLELLKEWGVEGATVLKSVMGYGTTKSFIKEGGIGRISAKNTSYKKGSKGRRNIQPFHKERKGKAYDECRGEVYKKSAYRKLHTNLRLYKFGYQKSKHRTNSSAQGYG